MEAWAQLVSLTDMLSDPVLIQHNSFSLGRNKGCDKSFLGNRLVSGEHCRIQREEDGTVWLHDSSTNGTLVNLSHKVHKNKIKLHHGDEFYIVYKKNDADVNIGYVYNDMAALANEDSEQTVNYESSELDATQEYDQETDDGELADGEPSVKKRRVDETDAEKPVENDAAAIEKPEKSKPGEKVTSEEKSTSEKKSTAEAKPSSSCDGPPEAKAKDAADGKVSADEAAVREGWGAGAKKAAAAAESAATDPYEDNLICTICQDIFYNCVSLQPCLHSFCAGCYSDWMKRSRECPTCRLKVDRINKNHLVNNLIDAYLKQHPEKKRSEDDIQEQDKKNKITAEMLYPEKPTKTVGESEEDSDENSDEDSDQDLVAGFHTTSVAFGNPFMVTGTAVYRPPKTVCRQCPEYRGPVVLPGPVVTTTNITPSVAAVTGPSTSNDAGEGTSSGPVKPASLPDVKVMPQAPQYICPADQTHILCQCCLQPMPDRRTQFNQTCPQPPVQCTLCYRLYCHAYWGCSKGDCSGCLGFLKDLTFNKTAWNELIMKNPVESAILQKYAIGKGMSLRDLLQDCCTKLDAGQYKCQEQAYRTITSNSSLCYHCGLKIFGELAYQYRENIPKDQIPAEAKNRPDCYWGKNCRTQVKFHHAQRFNHICEQTRKT